METNSVFYQSFMADNYDRMSNTYDKSMDYKWLNDNDPRYLFENMVNDSIKANIYDQFKALDVGTGTGRISLMMAKNFPNINVKGLDQSKKMIEVANTKAQELGIKNINFDNYSVESKLRYDNETFDLVTCSLAMIYFTQKQKFISEVGRILKDKGQCLISTIGPIDMVSALEPFWELYYKFNPEFKNNFNPRLTEEELENMFKNAGFNSVELISFKEKVVFGSLKDYFALFTTYGLNGLLFFLSKSAAVQLMEEYEQKLKEMLDESGRLVVMREVIIAKGIINKNLD
ncbi:class I SAM-dependent methyltransferase [Clostridium sporogenes]|uniref:class I SAM-dependent methyltransferase n=1 Tax=Clostridium sporogenes TaxID=1509 RepID=UPI0006B26ACF|nr:class I SAM-dependent methyltransferase [Clostridium sporogenes]MDS1006655.1 methyltransferase domain-containing protein [Clostridium sporogenes]